MKPRKSVKFPPNIEIDEEDFKRAWAKLVMKIMQVGMDLPTEYGGGSKDVCSRITLTGGAIGQILRRDVHRQDPFGGKRIEEYMQQYSREYDWETQGFEYTYMERLATYPRSKIWENSSEAGTYRDKTDQLRIVRDRLKNGVTRRAQMITWIPEQDSATEHPPCLQRIWVRPLLEKTCEVHLSWRSRDVFGAWNSNICAITDMLYREVLTPNNIEIVKLVDFCNSAQIYEYDWDAANKVRLP